MSDAEPTAARHRPRGRFRVLLRVQARLAMREPYFLVGFGLPVGLLVLFWIIGLLNPGTVGTSGLTILELYLPTVLVIGYGALALVGLPMNLVRDREMGWLRRVSTTPVPPSRLLAAQMVLNLVVAAVATVIVLVVGAVLFGAPLVIGFLFVGVAALALLEMFSLGLVVAAIAPTQQAAQGISGGLFFLVMFLSGLWVQPVQVGGGLATVMYYSPSGAAVRALLYSVFNAVPPYTTIVTMAVYAVIFTFIAIRSFRWE